MLAAICLFAWKAVARANTGNAQVLSPDLIFGGFGDLGCIRACRGNICRCQQNGPSRSQARSLQRRFGVVDWWMCWERPMMAIRKDASNFP